MESAVDELKAAMEKGKVEHLKAALTQKLVSPKDRTGKDGFTLIHWACFYGLQEALQILLLYGGPVTVVEKHGWTPLHLCGIHGRNTCLQVLLDNGGNLQTKDNRGYSCAHLAAAHGNSYTLKTMLEKGFDVNIKDSRHWTPAHHAAFHGRYGALQLLAKWGSDIMTVDKEGNLPAHLAAREGHIECLRLLVYYNHSPLHVLTSCNDKGATPKDLSIQFQKQDCADFLASAVTEAEIEDLEEEENEMAGRGALQAAYEGNLQLLSMLVLEGHCNVNQQDKGGSTPAHKAAGNGHVKSFHTIAAGNGHVKCLQWLLDHGADMSLKNNLKETPLDVAKKYGKTDCIALLGGGIGLDTEEDIDHSPHTLEQAQEQIKKLSRNLEIAKSNYKQLGGIFEEETLSERILIETKEHHTRIVANLERQLEAEKEKRELLEQEMDTLRIQLHQANESILHYQTLLSARTINETPSTINYKGARCRTQSGRDNVGGAYFRMNK